MIFQFFSVKITLSPLFCSLIVEISKDTRSLLFVNGTCLLAFVIFFCFSFPVAHDSHGCSKPFLISYPRCLDVALIWYSPMWPKISCTSETDIISPLSDFPRFYSHLYSIGPYIRVFMHSYWGKCIPMPLLVCWELYQTPTYKLCDVPIKFPSVFYPLCYTEKVVWPNVGDSYILHYQILQLLPIVVIMGYRQVIIFLASFLLCWLL